MKVYYAFWTEILLIFFLPTKKDRSQNSLKLWCNLDLYKFIALEMSNLWKAGYTFTQDLTTKYGPFYNEIHMNLKYHETWHPQNLFLTKNSSLRVLSLKNLYISNLTLVLTLRTMTSEEEQSVFFFFVQTMVSGNQLKHRSDFGNLNFIFLGQPLRFSFHFNSLGQVA